MNAELAIKDVRTTSLDYEQARKRGLSPLQEFFQFWRYPRNFLDPARLHDCYFYDVYLTHFVANWPSYPSPPHPGMFQDIFPTILGRLMGEANTLTLFVKSIDPEYFNELDVIKKLLGPRNLSYILLSNPIRSEDRRTQVDIGHLIFEWPLASFNYIVEEWFMSPQVTIEGYISQEPPLAQIASLYFKPDTEQRIRELLSTIEVGFRVWPDNNGIFILTDKLDVNGLNDRLRGPDLNQLLEEASRRYDV